ncbi:DUF523 domain-containing protein [Paremcibacter congregatus]|uniref:DUF523 domain-containing protein n=1 Tax=Paremcibacter congregatus TaxID=2043170 RepID=UPI00195990A4|nr:DUF523 domain-containing protein [Paremcibacter congregatus]
MISSCLLGHKVRYDGGDKYMASPLLEKWQAEDRLVPVCPEMVGGLPAPRPAAEIRTGDGEDVLREQAQVFDAQGTDHTEAFIRGAERALTLARENGCQYAILTEYSPSCGSAQIYNGQFDGTRRQGKGVTAALLEQHGIQVYSSENFQDLQKELDI